MASQKQVRAARENVRRAQRAARRKRTIAHLPEQTRRDLVREAQKGRRRGGQASRS